VRVVTTALETTRGRHVEGHTPGRVHREKSAQWVECLADQFRSLYRADRSVRVFSRADNSNRDDFGTNELLHDVCVCRVGQVRSAVRGRALFFIREVLWQVESEFSRNSRESVRDFSKLVCGSGRSKLFVGSKVADCEALARVLLPAAAACTGNVFLALVPHPGLWDTEDDVDVWRLERNIWSHFEGAESR
jgi:hypothetical protein